MVIHCQCSGKELKGLAVCEWRVISTLVRQLLPARPSGFFSSEANLCNVTSKKPQLSKICREAIFTKCCNRFKSSRPRKLTILVENDFSIFFLITQLVMMSRIQHSTSFKLLLIKWNQEKFLHYPIIHSLSWFLILSNS